MTSSQSETFLKALADRSFLKLWAIPNTYFEPGKEMTDLVVIFGDDIVIISDKASDFDTEEAPEIAWRRWCKGALKKSLKQLEGAMRTIRERPDSVFLDAKASQPTPLPLGPSGGRRLHLVGIARPRRDPEIVPATWPGLTYVGEATERPFQIGRLDVKDAIVHLFDGPTINLLLETLDTAPDFIAYLKGRETALRAADKYEFVERDLLAAAVIGWDEDRHGLPSVPPLATVVPGAWEAFTSSETARRRREADAPSRIIDRYINQQYEEFAAGRFLYGKPEFEQHERAMRLLASESRFARRVIAHELHDILAEKDLTTYWASTVASPTMPSLRYVWLTYPKRPDQIAIEEGDRFVMLQLQNYVLVAQALFDQFLVLGICLPNPKAGDTAIYTVLHGKVHWTDADQEYALELHKRGIFSNLEAIDRIHIR